jgi:hypothetical protein
MAKNKQQAKKMASAGKSAAQIKAKTGVSGQTAQKYVAKQPSSGGGGGGNNRQEVKEVAKQAAVSGTYNKSNTQALKEAGVSKAPHPNH